MWKVLECWHKLWGNVGQFHTDLSHIGGTVSAFIFQHLPNQAELQTKVEFIMKTKINRINCEGFISLKHFFLECSMHQQNKVYELKKWNQQISAGSFSLHARNVQSLFLFLKIVSNVFYDWTELVYLCLHLLSKSFPHSRWTFFIIRDILFAFIASSNIYR